MKKNTFKRIASLIIAVTMVFALIGCGSEEAPANNNSSTTATSTTTNDNTSKPADTSSAATTTTTTDDTSAPADTAADAEDEPVDEAPVYDKSKTAYIDEDGIWRMSATDEVVDLGGMTIQIADWWSVPGEPETAREIATADYRDEIMETYNFNIEEVKWSTYGDFMDDFNDFATSGVSDEYYVFAMGNAWLTTPMRNGLFADLTKVDCLDFSEEKWDPTTANKTTLKNAVYGMRAAAAEPRGGVYFNKRLLEEGGVDPNSLYEMQANGTWTWDEFEKICNKLTRDTDGDGINDIYAMSSFNGEMMNAVLASNGAQIISIDPETGYFINTTNTDAFIEAYDWAHNLRQLYEAPQPEDTDWDYSYGLFQDAQVAITICEQYHASGFKKNMVTPENDDNAFGFVVFPKGPKVSDYNGYSTDNAYIIPSLYDDETIWKIAFAYNLFTDATPGYEDDDDWKTAYYNVFCDEESVDQTLEILRTHQEAAIYPLVPNVNKDNNYWWNIDYETGAERSETMWDEIQALLDAVNF